MRLAWCWVLLAGCSMPAAEYGEQLFNDPQFAGSEFNQWNCTTCHSVRDPTPGRDTEVRILAGGSLLNVARRPSYWGGHERRLIDAVTFCYVYFMRGLPLPDSELASGQAGAETIDQPHSDALFTYLATLDDGGPASAVKMTISLAAADVPRGNKDRGEQVYRQACLNCHGDVETGLGANSTLASVLPNIAQQYGQIFPGVPPSLVFIEKVRHGQFFRVGGNMPLFTREALTDGDLGALLAYLGQ